MIITCPRCSARYLADATAIGPAGRRVRCASCGHDWFHAVSDDEATAPPLRGEPPLRSEGEPRGATPRPPADRPSASVPRPAPSLTAPRTPDRPTPPAAPPVAPARKTRSAVPWIVLLLVLVAVAAAAWTFRARIAQAYPQVAGMADMVGLGATLPATAGLVIQQDAPSYMRENDSTVLVVTGAVTSLRRVQVQVPPLHLVLGDRQGRVLQTADVTPEQPAVPPGGRMPFRARVENPPQDASTTVVRFK